MKRVWTRLFKWFSFLVLAVTGILVLTAAGGMAILMIVGSLQVGEELRLLAQAGGHLQEKEIIPAAVDDDVNGAPLLMGAWSLLLAEKIGSKNPFDLMHEVWECEVRGAPGPDIVQNELLAWVQSKSAARIWDLLHEAALRKVCRFPMSWDEGYCVPWQNENKSNCLPWDKQEGFAVLRVPAVAAERMSLLTRALSIKALVEARAGLGDEAWMSLSLGLSIADMLKGTPSLLCQGRCITELSRMLGTIRMASAIGMACTIARPSEEQALGVVRHIAALDPSSSLAMAWEGEHLLVYGWLRKRPPAEALGCLRQVNRVFMTGAHDFGDTPHPSKVQKMLGEIVEYTAWFLECTGYVSVRDLEYAWFLRLMQSYFLLKELSPRERLVAADTLSETPSPWYPPSPWYRPGPISCAPSEYYFHLLKIFGDEWKVAGVCQSEMAVTQAGLLLQIHKLRHGAYPETLDGLEAALKADLPLDPLTGCPLLYRHHDEGCLVYSVGANLVDDGGSNTTGLSGRYFYSYSGPLDIVWPMPYPTP